MEISDRAYRIVTRKGFLREFWSVLRMPRQKDERTTQRLVFETLNDLYEESFGESLFASWDAFRKFRDQHPEII